MSREERIDKYAREAVEGKPVRPNKKLTTVLEKSPWTKSSS